MKNLLTWLLAILLAVLPLAASADAPVLTEQGLALSGSSVYYPVVSGLADEAVQAAVNQQLVAGLHADAYISRMALLMSNPVKLTTTYTAAIHGDVLTATMAAQGAVVNNRATHVWSAANLRLSDGSVITLDELLTDPEAARTYIGEYLDVTVAPELSAHLSAGALLPLPEVFSLSPNGLTLYYPIGQLSTLSDRAGSVELLWCELKDCLNLDSDVLIALGVPQQLTLDETTPERLTQAFSGGSLPGIDAALGQSVQALTDTHGLLIDPDLYEGGRMFLLEGAAFRGIALLTDALTEDWDRSVVQGLRADRLNLHGLCTGITTRAQWQAALGQPESSVTVDASRAESWRIVPGVSDYYTFGAYRLRLHADENGVLTTVFLTE